MKQKILVIDDEESIRKLLENFLSKTHDYDVVCKSDGVEALEWLQEDLPNLIICDVQMKNLDGYAFLKKIRQPGQFTEHTPVVMLSGVESSKERIKCYTDGAQDFLAKPFHPKELLALIQKNLEPIHYDIPKDIQTSENKKTILIIDDEPITRKLLENLIKNHKLNDKNIETVSKSDGKDALFWLEGNNPDLIICDVQMAPMDGYNFLKNFRQRGYSKHTPVLMLSGVESPTERIQCYTNGAQDFVAKPFNPEELWKLIDKNLNPVHFAKNW